MSISVENFVKTIYKQSVLFKAGHKTQHNCGLAKHKQCCSYRYGQKTVRKKAGSTIPNTNHLP